jgi:excinuclease ABC subunit C
MKASDYRSLPETPGVYLMKDAAGKILYVGKAGNLRRRVSSYFDIARRNFSEGGAADRLRPGSGESRHDVRIQTLVARIATIDHRDTETAIEALILEAELIKKLSPPFNVREKDDKSFLYIEILKEKFPRVMLVRGRDIAGEKGKRFGPFTSASSAREALKILRKIFPWSTHPSNELGAGDPKKKRLYPERRRRACFDYEIGLCPGTCVGAISRTDYLKNIGHLKLFLEGKKARVVKNLEKDMAAASKKMEFEKAAKLRGQIFALKHIEDTAFISDSEIVMPKAGEPSAHPFRIEGYDISNISGTSAVGSMVVFENGRSNRNEYRKFKIRTVVGPNDVAMLAEVLTRRFKHAGWRLPDMILIDGGLPQTNAAYRVMRAAGLRIPLVGLAKGPERKRNDIVGAVPKNVSLRTLIQVRDEAHRFAISYHKALRRVKTFE